MLLPAMTSTAHLVGPPTIAGASNFSGATGRVANCAAGDHGGLNMADAQPHTYHYTANVANNHSLKTHQDWAWNSVYGPTSVTPQATASPTTATDVVFYAQDYANYCGRVWHPATDVNGSSTVGLAICVSLNPGAATCEKHEVRYDLSYWNLPIDDGWRRKLSCHEIAHTFGMVHPEEANGPADSNSCTISGGAVPIDYISPHDVWHINGAPDRLVPSSLVLPARLGRGEKAKSWDGRYTLSMNPDGNLVVYDGGNPIWASNTFSNYYTWAVLQTDGNFVVYSNDGWGTWALCSTHTNGRAVTHMVMQVDGNLVLYAPGNVGIWASKSGGRCWL